ncbi:hypothetical protein T440DRAFT_398881 [Plenodomus tracheiphilus IPT5]|uniref:HTH CENPB-type domain-containing protein n=1 Tax=Plenodomus tracheiphilus IPT5 TaxID=1408161 RepID=A0A6A7B2P9_9PLEO|nr:hypothetical protein T440DRAFT_398881 [Plenodomus tracheiphilus IPT5]
MDPINAAIEFLESQPSGAQSSYTKVAAQFNIDRRTLSRRHQRQCTDYATKSINQRLLSQQQELDLVTHIRRLTKEGCPPARRMLRNYCTSITGKPASESWVTRFLHRHKEELKPHRSKGKDRTRHKADSIPKYESYFRYLHGKIGKYHLRPSDIYNMDEKGFHLRQG